MPVVALVLGAALGTLVSLATTVAWALRRKAVVARAVVLAVVVAAARLA